MPSRPIGNWTRLEVFFNGALSKEWSNIFWFIQSAMVPTADIKGDTALLKDYWANQAASVQSSSVSSIGCVATINNGTGSYSAEDYGAVPGTLMNDPIPEDNAVVVQRLSATAGPSGRGRIFVAGIDNSLVTGSYLNVAGTAAFTAIATALLMPVAGATVMYAPATFSPNTGNLLPITSWETVDLIGTNRRRRPRF